MKKYAYRNHKFNGYEITVSGSVYRRDRNGGAIRRVKGKEAMAVIAEFIEHRKAVAARIEAAAGKAVK